MSIKEIREILETRKKVAIKQSNATELLLICSLIEFVDDYEKTKVNK